MARKGNNNKGGRRKAPARPRRRGNNAAPRWGQQFKAGGFETGAVAPQSYSAGVIARDPLVKTIPGGVRVTHMEKAIPIHTAAAVVKLEAVEVSPRSFPWIKGFAHHFQNFRVVNFHVHSAPVASTTAGTRVVMSPYYASSKPFVKGAPTEVDKAFVDFGTLPGAKQFAGWAEAKVSWIAARAVRQTFKLFNIGDTPTSLQSQISASEDETPGYVICEMNSPGAVVHVADLWVEYTFDLLDPIVRSNGTVVRSASTDSSALLLENCSLATGLLREYTFLGNTIRFNVSGFYTVIVQQSGTDPIPDWDGHSVIGVNGVDRTKAAMLDVFDVSSGVYDGSMDSGDQNYNVASATKALQVLFLKMFSGDLLTLDTFTSGSLTATNIVIVPGAPQQLIRE